MKNIKTKMIEFLNENVDFSTVDDIIQKVNSGKLSIDVGDVGYFIYTTSGDDESYMILPFDDDIENDWYISSPGGEIEEISREDTKKILDFCENKTGNESQNGWWHGLDADEIRKKDLEFRPWRLKK